MFVNECLTQCLPGDWVQNILSESSDIYGECAKCRPLWSVLGVNRQELTVQWAIWSVLRAKRRVLKDDLWVVSLSLSLGKGESSEWSCALFHRSRIWLSVFCKDRLRKEDKDEKGSMCLPSLGNRATCVLILISVEIHVGIPRLSVTQCSFGTGCNILLASTPSPMKPAPLAHKPWDLPHGLHSCWPSHTPAASFYFFDHTVQHMAS